MRERACAAVTATYATTQPTYARNLHFPKKMISLSHSNPLRMKRENEFLEEKKMMKKKVLAMMCVAAMAIGMTACGGEKAAETPAQSESSQTQETETQAAATESEEETAEGAVLTTDLLFNDADEFVNYVPFAPIGNSYAEAMMQVTGYTYTFIPDGDTYTLELVYECGTPGEDTTMYMKRDYTFTGTCTADGDVYTLDTPEHFTMTQETAGQFAATSGEGGADFWGPNGLTIDETYTNDDNYNGLTADDILAAFQPCKAIVNGDALSFEEVEGAENGETTEAE